MGNTAMAEKFRYQVTWASNPAEPLAVAIYTFEADAIDTATAKSKEFGFSEITKLRGDTVEGIPLSIVGFQGGERSYESFKHAPEPEKPAPIAAPEPTETPAKPKTRAKAPAKGEGKKKAPAAPIVAKGPRKAGPAPRRRAAKTVREAPPVAIAVSEPVQAPEPVIVAPAAVEPPPTIPPAMPSTILVPVVPAAPPPNPAPTIPTSAPAAQFLRDCGFRAGSMRERALRFLLEKEGARGILEIAAHLYGDRFAEMNRTPAKVLLFHMDSIMAKAGRPYRILQTGKGATLAYEFKIGN